MLSKSCRSPRKSFLGIFPNRSNPLYRHSVLDQSQLADLVKRERMRAYRRGIGFCLLLFDRKQPIELHALEKLIVEFRDRLRLTDDLGVLDQKLAVVLPDTDADGGQLVANDLLEIAKRLELDLDCELVTEESELDNNSQTFVKRPHFGGSHSRQDFNEDSSAMVAVLPRRVRTTSVTAVPQRSGVASLFVRPVPRSKRFIDIVGASFGLIALSPLFALTAIAIRRESPGAVLFKQLREGKDGRQFWIYKFRTMQDGADAIKDSLRQHSEQDGPAFKMTNDPRVTKVGKFLRKTCIDEVPQLINVLRGEMSLVGPRPLPVNESQACEEWQRQRLEVLPGMTCTWQVDGGRNIPFSDWMRMDLSYLRRQSLLFDISLIIRTTLVALRMKGSV